jgi:hypothetical protein
MPASINLLVAYPKELIRAGLRAMLAGSLVKLVGEASDAPSTLTLAKKPVKGNKRRDNFRASTKQQLAERVAFHCSNPECKRLTSGPKAATSGSVNLGVASHIEAASPLGPRANPALTAEQRRSSANGIWLCQNCAKLIDSDEDGYSAADLQAWKHDAEDFARRCLQASGPNQPTDPRRFILMETAKWQVWREEPDRADSPLRFVT